MFLGNDDTVSGSSGCPICHGPDEHHGNLPFIDSMSTLRLSKVAGAKASAARRLMEQWR